MRDPGAMNSDHPMLPRSRAAGDLMRPAADDALRILLDRRLLVFVAAFEIAIFCVYLLIGATHGSYRNTVCNWDCNWYGEIATRGYDAHPDGRGYANWAFFPLFPLLSRGLMHLSGESFVTCASALNFAAFFAVVVAGAAFCRQRFGSRDPFFVALVFLCFPIGIYFRLPYSESLYGLLVLTTLLLAARGRLLASGLFAGLACFCRPTGILLVGSIGLVALIRLVMALLRGQQTLRTAMPQVARLAAFGIIGVAGLLCYALYLDRLVGDPLAFSHAMGAWDRHYASPLARIGYALSLHDMSAAHFLSSDYRPQTYLALFALLSLPLILWAFALGAPVEGVFLLGTLILSSATGLESEPRYMFCNPVSIALIVVALEKLPLPVRWSVPALFGAAQVVLVFAWFNLSAFMT